MLTHRRVFGLGTTGPARQEVWHNRGLFKEHTWRQDARGSPHHDTETIFLRSPWRVDGEGLTKPVVFNRLTSVDEEVQALFPAIMDKVQTLMELEGADSVGRVMVVKLAAGGAIDTHVDEGAYPTYYSRYHYVIDGESVMTIGGVDVVMLRGDCFWVNTGVFEHKVTNPFDTPRNHLIIDLRIKDDGS